MYIAEISNATEYNNVTFLPDFLFPIFTYLHIYMPFNRKQ